MEFKWYAIMMVGIMLAMFGSLAIGEYSKNKGLADCRVTALQQGKSAADIAEICK